MVAPAKKVLAAVQSKDSVIYVQTRKIKVSRKEWQDSVFEYRYHFNKKGPIRNAWIGLHYATMPAMFTDSLGTEERHEGFNFQMMSGNLRPHKSIGIYAGFDWGMMFYGRTPNSNVVINTQNEESGYTRLKNNSMDLMFKLHVEYANSPVVPYINASLGTRFYYTNQRVRSYLALKDNESGTTHNAAFTASLMAGLGVGARVKLAPRVSLDARYDYMIGTKTSQVDLQRSRFNGLNYNLVKRSLTPSHSMLRLGIILDLSGETRERVLKKPGHYKEVYYDSLIVENVSDSSVIVLPCECNCKESTLSKKKEDSKRTPKGNDEEKEKKKKLPRIQWDPGSDGSSGGGSSKGSFPGIKTPPPVQK